ncbi:MAG: glycosyltransferase [Clostridia bacterium]|nr:glycosyltransferase [Clostridia bacterium]
MKLFDILLSGIIVLGMLYSFSQFILFIRIRVSLPKIKELEEKTLEKFPKISIVIPACNEEAHIEEAVRSRLKDDYPNLEIILINDRSIDSTGEIIDRIAEEDSRIKTVHIKALPEGWLGKLYALHKGALAASGEWILFSDADVHVRPGVLNKVVSYCNEKGIEFLAVLPQIWPSGFLVDTILSYFIRIVYLTGGQIWAVENPKSKVSIGVGAFNFVKRSSFLKTKGFEWLRLELADDMGLGAMMKDSGAKCSVLNGLEQVELSYYSSVREMMVGLEKIMFTHFGNFSMLKPCLISLCIFLLDVMPFIAVLLLSNSVLKIIGMTILLLNIIGYASMNRWARYSVLPAACYPLGSLIFIFFLLRAGYLGVKRGGVIWRGTMYSNDLLKEGKRFGVKG